MTFTFVIGAFVTAAFLLVPLGILVAFALMREPRPPGSAVGRRSRTPSRDADVPRHWGSRRGAA